MNLATIPSEELLGYLFNNIHMPIALMDIQFNFIKINEAYTVAINKKHEDLIGKNYFHVFPDTEKEVIFQQVVSSVKPFSSEKNLVDGIGHWAWTLLPINNGDVTGVLLLLNNVTDYMVERKKLYDEYHLTKVIMDMAGDLIIVMDNRGKIVEFNKAAQNLTGYSFEDVKDKHVWDILLIPDDVEPVKNIFNQLTLSIPNEYENIWLAKNGKHHSIHWNNTFINNEAGELEYIIGFGLDVTQRKKTRLILERQAKIIDQLRDSVISTDLDGYILSWNKGAEKIFGYTEEEALNKNVSILYSENRREFLENKIIQPLKEKGEYEIETIMIRRSGEEFYSHLSLSLLYDDSGKPYGMVGYSIDISERKRIENELENYQKNLEKLVIKRTEELTLSKEDAEHANQLKSSFLSRMSHELRTPMNAIIGFSQLLKMENLSSKEISFVDEVTLASKHLLSLIDEVLDLSRIESGNFLLDLKPVSLYQLSLESIAFVNFNAEESSIVINNHIRSDKDVLIFSDPIRFKEIIVNFLTNAIKYNKPNGEVTLAYENMNNDFVRVSVTDTGTGISIENQADIFEPFNRLGAEYTDIEGTGIGLTIAKQLITLLGGKIGVESKLNVGSCFWVECPISHDGVEEELKEKRRQPLNSGNKKLRVLYIEDNPANLRLIQHVFSNYGNIELLSAMNAEDGFTLAKENELDLVLLDINLPGIDGYEALKVLQKNEKTKNINVLAISATAGQDDIKRGLLAGFKRYITKPIDIDEFIEIIELELGIE